MNKYRMFKSLVKLWVIFFSVASLATIFGVICNSLIANVNEPIMLVDLDFLRRSVEDSLAEALKADKGMGCQAPKVDPFAKEMTQFDDNITHKIECTGKDWVKCYHSNCRVVDEIRQTVKNIICKIEDILYVSDNNLYIGSPTYISAYDNYELKASDHIRVSCSGVDIENWNGREWNGNALGFRSSVRPKTPPPGRENGYNVMMLGFDSASLHGFIRLMPRSWKVLTEELGATVMNLYNIVGYGTAGALFPILTGFTELELPDVRISKYNQRTVDNLPFIFYKLKEDGYRTAYFEDMPYIGTFQFRFNGWNRQPTDHYLRAFFLEERAILEWCNCQKQYHCVGDTPQYKLMLNITEQFLELDAKRFAFTFIVDISHEDFNLIRSADDDVVEFLRNFVKYSNDTLLIVMGDHGPRYGSVRDTLAGKLAERLPLMALLLPKSLSRERPEALAALKENSEVLTTPHDLHATILDVLGMRQHWNTYKVPGADLYRGLTMLEPIPRSRSCSEAGVEPHWCTCLAQAASNVSTTDPLYRRTAEALLGYINSLLEEVKSLCEPRTLTSVQWVFRQRSVPRLSLNSSENSANDFYGGKQRVAKENYQVKIIAGPGIGVYEASMTYIISENRFLIKPTDISRTSLYGHEADCIRNTHPHLNSYCYCRKQVGG